VPAPAVQRRAREFGAEIVLDPLHGHSRYLFWILWQAFFWQTSYLCNGINACFPVAGILENPQDSPGLDEQ
jgi:hypothetical protein